MGNGESSTLFDMLFSNPSIGDGHHAAEGDEFRLDGEALKTWTRFEEKWTVSLTILGGVLGSDPKKWRSHKSDAFSSCSLSRCEKVDRVTRSRLVHRRVWEISNFGPNTLSCFDAGNSFRRTLGKETGESVAR